MAIRNLTDRPIDDEPIASMFAAGFDRSRICGGEGRDIAKDSIRWWDTWSCVQLDGEEPALRDAGLIPDGWSGDHTEYELRGRRCKIGRYTKRLIRVTVYRHASEKEPNTRAMPTRRGKQQADYVPATAEGVLRRLGAVHGLVMFAEAFVGLRVGDSAKLGRALEDITAANIALGEIRRDLTKLLGNVDSGALHALFAKRTAESIAAWGRKGF